VSVRLAISSAAATGDLYRNRRDTVRVSCVSFGAKSVVADLSAINGPAALELNGNPETGEFWYTLEVTPRQAGLKNIPFKAVADNESADATASILVKEGDTTYVGSMSVERIFDLSAADYGCKMSGSCNGSLPITLTMLEDGTVTARSSSPAEPLAKGDCVTQRVTCEVKVVEEHTFTGTHNNSSTFVFYFWKYDPATPEIGEFKVSGTFTPDEARGAGEVTWTTSDGSKITHKVSFVLPRQ